MGGHVGKLAIKRILVPECRGNMLLSKFTFPICITIDVHVIAHFLFSGRPSLEKNYIFGSLIESAMNYVKFV